MIGDAISGTFPHCVPTLNAHGVTLRAHREEDLDRIVEQCQDELAQRYVPLPSPYSLAMAQDFLNGYVRGGWDTRARTDFAVADDNDRYLGSVGLHSHNDDRYEVGFVFHPDARGRGLATIATHRLLEWAFDDLGAQVVLWRANASNEASTRIATKLGFELSTPLVGWFYRHGVYDDEAMGTLRRQRFVDNRDATKPSR